MGRLITFKTAKLAKEKGLKRSLDINGYLLGYSLKNEKPYPSGYKVFMSFPSEDKWLFAPTQSTLSNWLLENHGIFVTVEIAYNEWGRYSAGIYRKAKDGKTAMLAQDGMTIFDNPHDSMEEGLQEALNLI